MVCYCHDYLNLPYNVADRLTFKLVRHILPIFWAKGILIVLDFLIFIVLVDNLCRKIIR